MSAKLPKAEVNCDQAFLAMAASQSMRWSARDLNGGAFARSARRWNAATR